MIALAALLLAGTVKTAPLAFEDNETWTPQIPAPLVGPAISDPQTLIALDKPGDGKSCAGAGLLYFPCLVYLDNRMRMTPADLASNPFAIPVLKVVQQTIVGDLASIRLHEEYGGAKARGLDTGFLTFAGAKIELVGVINRMDRQFNKDVVPGHGKALACGEISAIYRFGYEGTLARGPGGDRHYRSRLPVTMNVVFPAIPWSGELTCRDVARRWLAYAEAIQAGGGDPAALRGKAMQIVSSLRPADIDRIELNMQGSRVTASDDQFETDFGSLATYIIRVFRWVPDAKGGRWRPSYLSNQIDRARLLGSAGDENTCKENRGKPLDRKALADWLLSMKPDGAGTNAIGDIDAGLINIPLAYLACRAVSVSPGGASRSANQPFWNSAKSSEQILADADIAVALARYRKRFPNSLSFVGTPDEFRTRLNEASCSGCHQTRAIAGFHFPGADRPGASPVNAVFLPGSPHFFGDQLRRMDILRAIAADATIDRRRLAASYVSRPQNRFAELRPATDPTTGRPHGIQLIGGWGGACLIKTEASGVRQWGCADGLECKPLFASKNEPDIGQCANPASRAEIGEAMQVGSVTSERFGMDHYKRLSPGYPGGTPRNTTIATGSMTAPAGNSYLAAHQEYYAGDGGLARRSSESDETYARRVRDQGTGGFPAGSLRLSECTGLPGEATCALLAASGFNDCLEEVASGARTPQSCFASYTNYSGVRACDPANPCRDDYICLAPMGYTQANAKARFDTRAATRNRERMSVPPLSNAARQLAITYFGERMPDASWLARNNGRGDRRGVCIPPYFVFQFKADGHSVPPLP